MIPSITHWLQRLLPNYCLLCKEPTQSKLALCTHCIKALPWRTESYCQRCGLALPEPNICGRCLKDPPSFDRVIAAFDYSAPIDQFVFSLKFSHKLIYAYILGTLQLKYILDTKHPLPEALIPVPLHPKRLRERGFNQAGEIAKIVAKKLKLPCLNHNLIRKKATKAQAQLKAKARRANVKNAFEINKPIPYSHIAIVDDVITTGATVRQICLTLKQSGVKTIDVWCAARANWHH